MTKALARIVSKTNLVFFILAAIVVIGAFLQPALISERAIRNILVSATPLAIVTLGQALVILTGGIDLSVGAIISLVNVIAASLMTVYPELVGPIVLLGLFVGTAIGAFNGWLVAYQRLNPFIITLAVGIALQGIALEVMYQPSGLVTAGFRQISRVTFGLIPVAIIVVALVYLLASRVLRQTSFGLSLRAIGGNATSAYLSGISTRRRVLPVYALSGFLAAAAGLFLAARISSGDPLVGEPYALDSITAAVLGGASLMGGVADLAGAFAATLLITLLSTLLNLNGISPFYQWILKGAILVAALSLDFLRRRDRISDGQ